MLDLLLGEHARRRAFDGSPDGTWTSLQMSQSYGPGTRKTQAGTVVNQDLALTYSACWCATRILCEPLASLPVCLMRRTPDGGSEHAVDDYRYDLVRNSPNFQMGAFSFKEGRGVHQINWGNGFAEIERKNLNDPRSPITGMWPIHPSRVRPITPQDLDQRGNPITEYEYAVRNNNGTEIGMAASELLHFAGALTEDGIWGKSVVAYGRESIGMGLGMERHGATQFGSGNLPRVVVFLPPKQIKDSEARREWRHEWKEIHGSPDSGNPALLPTDAKVQQMMFSNSDSQYLDSRRFGIHEIARLYRVPVHMLAEMEGRAGYNGLEHLSLEFAILALMPWIVRQEEQYNLKLLAPSERGTLYFKYDLSELTRGDPKTRFEGYEIGLRSGVLTLNMIYRKEGWPTIGPEGDQHFIMTNMTTAERIEKGLPPPSAIKPEKTAKPGMASAPVAEPQAETEQPQELLDLDDIRQTGSFDCGAAATQTVALYFGVDNGREEADYIRELGTTETDGTEPENIIDWLNDNGLVTISGQGMNLDDLRRFFAEGKPVIVPLQMYGDTAEYDEEEAKNLTGHYVVVQGIALGLVFFQDPIGGRQMMAEADFDQRWHDVEKEGVVDDHFGIAVSDGFGDQEEESEAEVQPSGDGAASSGASTDTAVAIEGARGVLVEALERAFTREAHQAMKAARKDLMGWLEERKASHREFLLLCLGPAFKLLEAVGLHADLDDVAGRLIEASSAELAQAATTDSSRKFEERMSKWSKRAALVADQIMVAGVKP